MSKSPLTNVTIPADKTNYTKGRSSKITEITIHHMAGVMTAEQCGRIFQRPGRNGSSHYGIGNDGRIGNYVDENNTAWTNSNWASNCRAITIETSNNKVGGDWTVSDKALKSLIKLVADIAKRYNIKLVKGKTLTWHSMYAKTICPGNYLRSKIDYIISEANKIINPSTKRTVSYRVYCKGHWYATAKDGQTAGDQINAISGVQVRTGAGCGNTQYRVHVKGGKWLPIVTKWDDTEQGYAGIKGKPIDGFAFKSEKGKVSYRVKTKKSGWLGWVSGFDINNRINGYAGNLGEEITAIQIKIV